MNDASSSPAALRALYAQAFSAFGALALWNRRPVLDPGPADARVVARALRLEGDMNARRLAEEIEAAARALERHAAD